MANVVLSEKGTVVVAIKSKSRGYRQQVSDVLPECTAHFPWSHSSRWQLFLRITCWNGMVFCSQDIPVGDDQY